MRIRLAIPEHLVSPRALEAALEATTLANEEAIARGEVPDIREAIASGVKWKPEPFSDGEHFDLAQTVIRRGWGDCDDLAPALAGSLRASGEDPEARPRVYQSGPGRWHVVVETSDGRILDPSRWAGMGKKKSDVSGSGGVIVGVGPAIVRPLAHPFRSALAVMPHEGRYHARCDIPYPESHSHLASLARASTAEGAIELALDGAFDLAEGIGVDCEGLDVVGALMLGDEDEIEEVGFLPALAALAPAGISLAKGLFGKKKKPAPPPAATQHPGGAVSVPVRKSKSRGGNDQHMMLSYYPAHAQGPVVMRF